MFSVARGLNRVHGHGEKRWYVVGRLICQAAQSDFEPQVDALRAQVKELTGRYPLYQNV